MFFELVSPIATFEHLDIAQPELASEFARQNLFIAFNTWAESQTRWYGRPYSFSISTVNFFATKYY